jgi:alpha-D-ribose 1-methylphosphonate 5-triphosphate synthase subunit PhnH
MITQLPGFRHPVYDAQRTFRAMLDAIAQPGISRKIAAPIMPPIGITSACAAACLTLFDLETRIWLQPDLDTEVQSWLRFHTGCRITSEPQQSDFALVWNPAQLLELQNFNLGTAEYPETSTTLFIQVQDLERGSNLTLTGPGILGERSIAPQLPRRCWEQWLMNHRSYPLGIDWFLFTQEEVMGIPRTVNISFETEANDS